MSITQYSLTTTGQSVRDYDDNGQLTRSTDSNGQNSVDYFTSSLDGIPARKDKTGETSYLHVAGKTIGDLILDKNGATHLTVYGGFTPTGTQEAHQAMMPSLWHKKYFSEQSPPAQWPNGPQDAGERSFLFNLR